MPDCCRDSALDFHVPLKRRIVVFCDLFLIRLDELYVNRGIFHFVEPLTFFQSQKIWLNVRRISNVLALMDKPLHLFQISSTVRYAIVEPGEPRVEGRKPFSVRNFALDSSLHNRSPGVISSPHFDVFAFRVLLTYAGVQVLRSSEATNEQYGLQIIQEA